MGEYPPEGGIKGALLPGLNPLPSGIRLANPPDGGPRGELDPELKPLSSPESRGA